MYKRQGIPLDFDFPTLLAYEGGLIPVLRKKQPHIIAGAAVGTRALNGKLCLLYTSCGLFCGSGGVLLQNGKDSGAVKVVAQLPGGNGLRPVRREVGNGIKFFIT